jgi:hypothetical protein
MAFQTINPHKWNPETDARLNGRVTGRGTLGEIVDLTPYDPETGEGVAGLGGLGQDATPWWQNLITWGTKTAGDILVPRFSLPPGTYESRDAQGNTVVLRQSDGQPVAFSAGQYRVGGEAAVSGDQVFGLPTGMLIAFGLGAVVLVMVAGRGRK